MRFITSLCRKTLRTGSSSSLVYRVFEDEEAVTSWCLHRCFADSQRHRRHCSRHCRSRPAVPEGRTIIGRRFNAGRGRAKRMSPEGTVEISKRAMAARPKAGTAAASAVPSGLAHFPSFPAFKRRASFMMSLRDKHPGRGGVMEWWEEWSGGGVE